MEPASFEVMPAVRLQKRRVVDAAGEVVEKDAVAHLRERSRAQRVYVIDHEGLQRNRADLDTLRKAGDRGNLWVDAGSRFATDMMDLLIAGAERVTVRWSHLGRESELEEAQEFAEAGRLHLGLEFRGGAFVANPLLVGDEHRVRSLARELDLGVVLLDLSRQGSDAGMDRGLAGRLQDSGLPRWFGGGVRDGIDTRELESLGYQGCFLERPPAASAGGPPGLG